MPLADPALLSHLAAATDPLLVPVLDGRPQPLQARYGAELRPQLEMALEREEPLRRTVDSLAPRLLDEEEVAGFGDPRRLLLNVNTPADVEAAERAARPGRPLTARAASAFAGALCDLDQLREGLS